MSAAEEWRLCPGYDGYLVSSLGRVVSLKGAEPRVLRLRADPQGYLRAKLGPGYGDGVEINVHRLVGEAFLGPRPEGLQTRHLNGYQTDNRLANLAYGTPQENTQDQFTHGTHRSFKRATCRYGHAYTDENTRFTPNGRKCRTCTGLRNKRRRDARTTEVTA